MSLKDKIAAQRKQIADTKASYQRSYKFKVGQTLIRVLPGCGDTRDEQEDFAVDYGAHYIKDPRDSTKLLAVVGDAEICYGKSDPVRQAITDYIHRCNERGDETSAKAAKEWLARKSHIMNIKVCAGPDSENNGKVVIWEASDNQYDAVLATVLNSLEAGLDPFDLNGGLVIQVERVGTGVQDTKYTFQPYLAANKYPGTPADLEARANLKSYRDGKFGQSVLKALGVMSNLLGYDVTTTAVGAALAGNSPTSTASQLSAPQTQPVTAADPSDDMDLLATDPVIDAVFEPVAEATATTPVATPAASPATADADIMAELDAL